jgi:hypothetical protein
MSIQNLWTALGRARLDLDFGGKLLLNPQQTLREAALDLSDDEVETLRQALAPPAQPFPGANAFTGVEDVQFQRKKMQERLTAQVNRVNELGEYTVNILKQTLDNARSAYHIITQMNKVMFFTGIALFVGAAVYGVISKATTQPIFIASLGAANFIALFLFGPIERTQIALSNLVQVEIAFMNYFEQITFWEAYALAPHGNPPAPDPDKIKEASAQLQARSQETIILLQKYVESPTTQEPEKKNPPE